MFGRLYEQIDKLDKKIDDKDDRLADKIDMLAQEQTNLNQSMYSVQKDLNILKDTMDVNTQELHEHKEGVIQNREAIQILRDSGKKTLKEHFKGFAMLTRDISLIIGLGLMVAKLFGYM